MRLNVKNKPRFKVWLFCLLQPQKTPAESLAVFRYFDVDVSLMSDDCYTLEQNPSHGNSTFNPKQKHRYQR